MSEYLVTLKATVPTWFGLSSQSREESIVLEAGSAQEATVKAKTYVKQELIKHGIDEDDLEDEGITVLIINVRKI